MEITYHAHRTWFMDGGLLVFFDWNEVYIFLRIMWTLSIFYNSLFLLFFLFLHAKPESIARNSDEFAKRLLAKTDRVNRAYDQKMYLCTFHLSFFSLSLCCCEHYVRRLLKVYSCGLTAGIEQIAWERNWRTFNWPKSLFKNIVCPDQYLWRLWNSLFLKSAVSFAVFRIRRPLASVLFCWQIGFLG